MLDERDMPKWVMFMLGGERGIFRNLQHLRGACKHEPCRCEKSVTNVIACVDDDNRVHGNQECSSLMHF